MIPRALSAIDSERARGGKALETPGNEEKEAQQKDKTKKEKRKCGQCLFTQGCKKGGRKWPDAKTSFLNSSFVTLPGLCYQDRNATAQRIRSARVHKIKELKNEIVDVRRRMEALSLENQALRELSGRHARAIDRYNNAKSHLQELLAGHRNELRNLRMLLKMSQESEKNMARELKRVETELRKTRDNLKTLFVLSEDTALAEREELWHRLSVLQETLEAKDEKIQSLETQLKLNNSTFSRQLASENRKLLEAGIITKNLIMEINSVHQKIKEKDRQLYIKNIYANRMPKALRDRSDGVPTAPSLRADTSVQTDKESFRALLLSQRQETEKNPIQLKKERKSSADKGREGKAKEECSDAQGRKEKPPTQKIPTPETSNSTHRGGKPLMEEDTFSEFMKEMEKETQVFKQELKILMQTEQNPESDRAKENHQEGDAVEEAEKGEKKPDEQQKKKPRSEGAIPTKEPVSLRRNYSFTEAVESLHQGLCTSGTKPRAGSQGSLGSPRWPGQSRSEPPGGRGQMPFGVYEPSFGVYEPSFGVYEPSFGQAALPGQDGAPGAQGSSQNMGAEGKELLREGENPTNSSSWAARAEQGELRGGPGHIPNPAMGSQREAPGAHH